MSQAKLNNPWGEINGGLRGSTLLRTGALLTILATLGNFASTFLKSNSAQVPDILISGAWLSWILALWLLAAGFIWIGAQPFMTRFGWFVGGFHLLNGVFLLAILFARVDPPLPSISLSIGRNLLLIFFVFRELNYLNAWVGRFLISISFLQLIKITFRVLDLMPSMDEILTAGLDSLFLTLLGLSLFLVGNQIKKTENQWALEIASTRASGFSAFNNPEHDWNKQKD